MTLTILKLGGSVLTGLDAYERAATVLRAELEGDRSGRTRFVVVVSAQFGATDQDLALARSIAGDPDPRALDLLWSTGELRSVALLTLALQHQGIAAIGLNVHETGLGPGAFDPSHVKAALIDHPIVVVPGFLARGDGNRVVTLGRGGSDLTAVTLAIGLDAARCELVKDVPGYFSEDPTISVHAQRLPALTHAEALAKESAGCGLVQRAAIEAAARADLPLIVRSLDSSNGHTVLGATYKRPHDVKTAVTTSAPSESEAWQAVGVGPHGT